MACCLAAVPADMKVPSGNGWRLSALSPSTRIHKNRLAFLITSDEEASAHNGTVKVVEADGPQRASGLLSGR